MSMQRVAAPGLLCWLVRTGVPQIRSGLLEHRRVALQDVRRHVPLHVVEALDLIAAHTCRTRMVRVGGVSDETAAWSAAAPAYLWQWCRNVGGGCASLLHIEPCPDSLPGTSEPSGEGAGGGSLAGWSTPTKGSASSSR